MKKIIFTLLSLLFISSFCFGLDDENSYMLVQTYKKDLKTKNNIYNFINEFIFDDEGFLLKRNTYYCDKEIDYYKWAQAKDKLKIKKQHFFTRKNNSIQEQIIDEDGSVRKGYSEEFKYIEYFDNDFLVVDDKLINAIRRKDIEPTKYYDIHYDSKNLFKFSYEPKKEEVGIPVNVNIFISKPIKFSEYAKRANPYFAFFSDEYNDNFYFKDIFFYNILKHDEYKYGNNAQNFVINKNNFIIEQEKNKITLTDYSTEDKNGMTLIKKNKAKEFLMLKNSDFVLLYKGNEKSPYFVGWNNSLKTSIVNHTKITASSYLKEGQTSYSPENLKNMTLGQVWVEGVEGDGIGEYIEFERNDATGIYLVNGFVQQEKPELYEKNGRVKRIKITGLDSNHQEYQILVDTAKPQYIPLVEFHTDKKIRIEILDVYKGTKFQDTCITSLILIKQDLNYNPWLIHYLK